MKGFRWKRALFSALCAVMLTGCTAEEVSFSGAYDITDTVSLVTDEGASDTTRHFFGEDLCVGEDVFTENPDVSDRLARAMGLFDLTTGEVLYSKNIYDRIYPASTTKLMTIYLTLKYGTLTDEVEVSARAVNQASDSSVCGLKEGDVITVEELLYGLMLRSGNDAAVALAEYVSGTVEDFADLMNEEAAALACTGSHFVNPNGLHDEDHYTTAYDLYLIFNAASQYDEFIRIIGTAVHTAEYTDAYGDPVVVDWSNTNKFINGEVKAPEGYVIIGGKTGTTSAAGYCLLVMGKTAIGDKVIAVVMKASGRSDLYEVMKQMMAAYN